MTVRLWLLAAVAALAAPPAAVPKTNVAPPRTTMPTFTIASPGVVTFLQKDPVAGTAMRSYSLDRAGAQHILHTTEWFEDGPELWQLEPLKPTAWSVPVPDGATLFGVGGAHAPELVHQLWVGWTDGAALHMQALMQEHPIQAPLVAGETPIFPGVMDRAGVAAVYTWRPVKSGTALWRHLFWGEIKKPGRAEVEALSEVPGHPAVSVAGSVPGETSQHAVLGWLESTPAGTVMGMAVLMPNQMRVFRSDPVAGTVPFANQRIAVWGKGPLSTGQFQVIGVVQSQAEHPSYQVAAFNVHLSPSATAVALSDSRVPPGELHAAAFEYAKDPSRPAPGRVLLTRDGTLLTGATAASPRRVSTDTVLPLVTGLHRYLGTRHPDGTLTFEGI